MIRMNEQEIQRGRPVILKADPAILGVLTGRTQRLGPILLAQVDWGANREYEDHRALQTKREDDDTDLGPTVSRREYGTIDDLRRRVTYEKLQGTLTDVFYSMASSQIDFYHHQFKPVLRFIDSPTNRLLLADEVGLGKTIEAGLIWTEWAARQAARRLLVVCPPSLCPKWERELNDRFQLPAVTTNAAGLRVLMERFLHKGPKLSFAVICSYDALRPRKSGPELDGSEINEKELLDSLVEPARYGRSPKVPDRALLSRGACILLDLLENEEYSEFLDMVVFDEAHRMKNTATTYHTIGSVLSSTSGACICLSATPIHNRSRDLFALLHMVDPDYFREEHAFDILRERNLPIVRLLNILSKHGTDKNDIVKVCRKISESPYFAESKIARKVTELGEAYDGSPKQAVGLYREADKLNLLGSYVTRTRKIQLAERRVERKAIRLDAPLTPEEKALYDGVLRHVRNQVRARGETVTSFHLIAPALRMSSCIPTMIQCLMEGKYGGMDELVELSGDFGLEYLETEDVGALEGDMDWVRDYDFEVNDSKYTKLKRELLGSLAGEKMLIFAFYKDTIRYLSRRLNEDGISTMVVTGDIKDHSERDAMMNEFESNRFQVLLLSEVGAEGVDLQFCRAMVNYDLPWNPMRVEQRIGRIDRIGQKAQSISIVNFYVPGTIDGLIYTHLYEKIGVFKTTIGDLEGIIGAEVSNLTNELLRDHLTTEQEERIVVNTRRAIVERRETEADLERSSGALVAYSDYLAENIGDSRRMGRYVKPNELRLYVDDFFSRRHRGSHLDWDTPVYGCGRLRMSFDGWTAFESFLKREQLAAPPGFYPGGQGMLLTCDPTVLKEQKGSHRSLVLVNHLHPLIKWMTWENGQEQRLLHGVAAVSVSSNQIPQGLYFYLIRRLTLEGLRKREKLHFGVHNISSGEQIVGDLGRDVQYMGTVGAD